MSSYMILIKYSCLIDKINDLEDAWVAAAVDCGDAQGGADPCRGTGSFDPGTAQKELQVEAGAMQHISSTQSKEFKPVVPCLLQVQVNLFVEPYLQLMLWCC